MGRHPVAVFILHITYARTMKVDILDLDYGSQSVFNHKNCIYLG
jgi:hypothetical protein